MEQIAPKKIDLPESTTILILGIFSIVLCGLIGLGLAITALILGNKKIKLYEENPDKYTESSFSNVKAGRTCAIIGLVLQSLILVGLIIYFLFIFLVLGVGMSQSGF